VFQAQTPSVLCLADEISSKCSWKEITDTTIRILPERTGTQQYARLCQYKDEAKNMKKSGRSLSMNSMISEDNKGDTNGDQDKDSAAGRKQNAEDHSDKHSIE